MPAEDRDVQPRLPCQPWWSQVWWWDLPFKHNSMDKGGWQLWEGVNESTDIARKVVQRMAALVLQPLVLFVFLYICLVFCSPSQITFTREELLNIGLSTGQTLSPIFHEPESFTAALYGIFQRCRRGKQAGVHKNWDSKDFKRRSHQSIWQMSTLWPTRSTNCCFYRSTILCFTKTWLGEHIPDNTLHLLDVTELLGKTKGSGICFCINEGWYTDVALLKKSTTQSSLRDIFHKL